MADDQSHDGLANDNDMWLDCEIDRTYECGAYDDKYDNYNDIPVWHCAICTFCNVEKLSFCSYCNAPYHTPNTSQPPIPITHKKTKRKTRKKSKKRRRKSYKSFEVYWRDMQCFIKRLNKYVFGDKYKQNVFGKHIAKLLREYSLLCCQNDTKRTDFSMSQIHRKLSTLCPNNAFKIRSLRSKSRLPDLSSVVFHGTHRNNINSIVSKGLIIGGTKGIAKRNGSAYGRGVYCSPCLRTACGYSTGSIFVCAASNAKKYGTVWVIPNAKSIVCCYLIEYDGYLDFSIGGSMGNIGCNDIVVFIPSLGKLNEPKRFRNRQRKFSNKGFNDGFGA
eukprot:550903_1